MDVNDFVTPLPEWKNYFQGTAVNRNQPFSKFEHVNTCITDIINLCEKHVFGQTASVQGILNVCSQTSGWAGYDQFCRQIINHCNEILSRTYEDSHAIINMCTKLSAFYVNSEGISGESEHKVNQPEYTPEELTGVTSSPTIKMEPNDEVLSEPDIGWQDQDSDSEDQPNEDDDSEWSREQLNAENSVESDKSCSKSNSEDPKLSTEMYKNRPKTSKMPSKRKEKGSVRSKKFSTPTDLKQHEESEKGNVSLQCDICSRTFGTIDSLKRHGRVHTGERPYICEICGNSYPLLSTLQGHMLVHTDDKPFHCQLCESKFKSAKRLRKHQQVHTGEKKYQCDTCGDRFAWSCSLKKHVMTVHSNESPFQCDLCHKKFKILKYLKKHELVHTDEYKYKCNVCGKQTRQKSNLDTHMRTHNGEKPYVCDKCGKRFAHNVTRKQHMELCFAQNIDFDYTTQTVPSLASSSLTTNPNFLTGTVDSRFEHLFK